MSSVMLQLNDREITLKEHTPSVHALDTATARLIAAHPTARIDVSPVADGWSLKPSAMVGSLGVNDHRIIIRPKLAMANLLALLDVTPAGLHWADDPFSYAHESDLLVSLVRLFARGLDYTLMRGLRHQYVERQERLVAMRGRIDMPALVRRPGPVIPVPCRFDEFTPDVPLNQLLRSALDVCLRLPGVPSDVRRRLMGQLGAFEGVGHHAVGLEWVQRWKPTRIDEHYAPSIRPAALILENLTVSQTHGGNLSTSFLVNMNKLIEKFVEDRLARFLPAELSLKPQDPQHLDTTRQVAMYPDLVVYRGNTPVFVADVKYKVAETIATVENGDLYQANTYAQVLDVRHAAIISSLGAAEQAPRSGQLTVRGSGVALHLWPVNFGTDLASIESQIAGIARRIVDLVASAERKSTPTTSER